MSPACDWRTNDVNVAIIGCGRVSRGHIRAWRDREDVQITRLGDVSEQMICETRDMMELPAEIAVATDY